MEIIIDLLKDKAKVNNASDNKKVKMKKFIKEWLYILISLQL